MRIAEILIYSIMGILFLTSTHFYQRLNGAFVTLRKQRLIKAAVYIGLSIVVNTVILSQDVINISLAFLGLVLLLLAGFEGSLLHKLSAAFILYPFVGSLNYLISALMFPLLPSVYTQANHFQFLFFSAFRSLFTCLFWFFMARMFAERLRYVKQYLSPGTLILLDLVSLTPLLSMIYIVITASRSLLPYSFPVILVNLLTNMGILELTVRLAENTRTAAENETLRLQQAYYQELEHNQQEIRRLRHDMNNHLTAIGACLKQGNTEEALQYFDSLSQSASVTGRSFCTNGLVNAILNAKYNLASEKGMEPFFHIELSECLPFDNIDLCSLFANVLDNAIEACEKVPDSQPRLLELRTRCSKGFFSFQSVNSYCGPLCFSGGVYHTTKVEPDRHGYGLARVEAVVHRYGGTLEIRHEQGIFTVTVIIPFENKTVRSEEADAF